MFVQLDHIKTNELQSNLDAIEAVFEVYLFDIEIKTKPSNKLVMHQQILMNSVSLAIEESLDLNSLVAVELDNTLVNLDNLLLEEPDLFSERNWFLSLLGAIFDPPYGTTLSHSNRAEFFKVFSQSCLLTEKDCEIYDWVGCSGSGRDDYSQWNDYFEYGREWWGNWCLTIYSPQQNKGCLLLASSTD
ncbi:MAG: hypothetical protein EKK63_15120 [Acinetobacter sp.]|uniref:hypothetical protein n=2 Tax=Acinetobacter TaxID=469 RepID=UPI000FBBEBB3|nr:hypothetical protein [Acinetobacter sp.]RUP37349.1 MAG: hypothetical protein EKK63_15120 [Acinetobacter sp.]